VTVVHDPGYRAALHETAVYLNSAVTAYDVRRELDLPAASECRVVYAVYDLVAQRVRARPSNPMADGPEDGRIFAEVPRGPEDFNRLGIDLATVVLGPGPPGRHGEKAGSSPEQASDPGCDDPAGHLSTPSSG
jgi:hypothetical protein